MDLKLLKKQAQKKIKETDTLKELNEVFKKYLGKKGELTRVLHSLKELPSAKKIQIGKQANEIKNFLKIKFDERARELKEKAKKQAREEKWIDITQPGIKPIFGHLHPLTIAQRETNEIFQNMGFEIAEGPEIETEWCNFDALNFPKDHPARDMQDTFWLKHKDPVKGRFLPRTHTSNVQIHYMQSHNPPLRIIDIGRVFRNEATDAGHEFNFYQLEALMVGRDVSIAHFKAIIQEFLKRFFKKPVKIRLRTSFFPFTEPSFEVDISCVNCNGKGCSVCQKTGWVELLGAGMVHPNVFKAVGYNPKNWQGFAFGIGFDRLVMMKYKINDIRLFYSGDIRFLEQF